MADKLSIQNEMRAFDQKDRDFYDTLTEDERKKFSTFLMMKYGANVEGISELQEYYLIAHNERVNINFFDIAKHPKLQWLLCTTVSPGMGTQRHYWLASKKREGESRNRQINFLEQEFPHLNDQELKILSSINSRDQLRDHARALGWTEDQIKRDL